MNKITKRSFIILGIISIITATGGIFYNANSLAASFSGRFGQLILNYKLLYFYEAFYAMSSFCIFCYLILLFCGINFLRMKFQFVWLFVSILTLEVVYFFAVAAFLNICKFDNLRLSISAAKVVANGGLMMQFLILFPLWGIGLAIWAKRKLKNSI